MHSFWQRLIFLERNVPSRVQSPYLFTPGDLKLLTESFTSLGVLDHQAGPPLCSTTVHRVFRSRAWTRSTARQALSKFLYQNGFARLGERDAAGWSPLCYAALGGNPVTRRKSGHTVESQG